MCHTEIIKLIAQKNGLEVKSLSCYVSGQINYVYELNNKYVVKIQGDLAYAQGVLKPQTEITSRLLRAGAKVPKILNAGEISGKPYLMMEKLPGNNLVYDWIKFSLKKKENFMAQLAEQLKIFHSLRFDQYAITMNQGQYRTNLKDAIEVETDFKRIDKNNLRKEYVNDIELLEQIYEMNKAALDEEKTAVLVHNDVHLENIFYQDGEITGLIDLDWISQAPRDYELWKLADVFYDPKKTVEKKLEPLYENYRMTRECGWLKKYYPQLFASPSLVIRIKLFSLENLINKIVDYQKGRWSEKVMLNVQKQVNVFYRSDWLEKLLV